MSALNSFLAKGKKKKKKGSKPLSAASAPAPSAAAPYVIVHPLLPPHDADLVRARDNLSCCRALVRAESPVRPRHLCRLPAGPPRLCVSRSVFPPVDGWSTLRSRLFCVPRRLLT